MEIKIEIGQGLESILRRLSPDEIRLVLGSMLGKIEVLAEKDKEGKLETNHTD